MGLKLELEDIFANMTFILLSESENDILTFENLTELSDYTGKIINVCENSEEGYYDSIKFNKEVLGLLTKLISNKTDNKKEVKPFLKKWQKANSELLNLFFDKKLNITEIERITVPIIKELHSNVLTTKKVEKIEDKILQMLLFKLGDVVYAISSNNIVEMTSFVKEELTIVPKSKPEFLGFINLRGEVIPLIDLRIFFGTKKKEDLDYDTEKDIIIAVKSEGKIIGILVDVAEDFINIKEKNIIHNTNFKDIPSEYIKGVVNHEDYDFLVLLNIYEFLKETKLKQNFLT